MNTQTESYHSHDLATEGFDLHTGKSWIYPINYPMREYQFRITQEALYQNTLVSLPTGLGKTFIASVVMYNFYRWYPSGKVIFMAPTRPLVKQQIDACYDITAIPQNVTAELTGMKAQTSREDIWKTKRVFFITPQVLQNDIDTFPDLAKQIKCIVFDEAHKARGNHAYCEVIRKLLVYSKYFRVLALSATPGNTTNDVIDVSMNLLISHLEVRTEESPDVSPYVFQRHLETIVVPLGGKLEEMRSKYLKVLEKYVKVLKDHNIITGNCANLTKGKIFMTLKDFNLRSKYQRHPKHNEISRNLTICITLYHGYELLIRHGMRGFLNFFEEHSKKSLLEGNSQLFTVMDEMQKYIGPRPDISLLPDGTIPQIEANSKFGHPKFYKLRNILLEYFANDENKESKVIIFSEFKETVMEAYAMLMQHPPLIRPKYFMGQGAITQKQQITIIKSFKEGRCNVLISTCIGEEGLDIGEVDLIICFDISNKSPIRLIQRMGRTGRKKQGKVIILVTEGKEQELLKEALASKTNLSVNVLKSNEIPKHLYKENPRMIPDNIFPTCNKMFISVPKVTVKGKSGNIKDMFNNLTRSDSASQILKDVEIIEKEEEMIPPSVFLWNQSDPLSNDLNLFGYNKPLDTLRVYQPVENIQHSKDTDILVSLLQFVDAKRYNLPITQTTAISQNQNKKRKITKSESNDNFKQTDIRNLFIKPKTTLLEAGNENISQENEIKENVIKKKYDSLTNDLFAEITSYLNICFEEKKLCFFCEKTCLCKRLLPESKSIYLNPIDFPPLDLSSIQSLTEKDFDSVLEDLVVKSSIQDLNDVDFERCFDDDIVIIDEESLRMETPKKENTYKFEPPKSIKKVMEHSVQENVQQRKETQSIQKDIQKNIEFLKKVQENEKSNNKISNLDVFHLENVEDLFEVDTDFEKSPVLFDDSLVILNKPEEVKIDEKNEDKRSPSPIFGSFSKRTPQKLKINLKSKLESASKSSFYINKKDRVQNEDVVDNKEEKIVPEDDRNSNHSNYSDDLFDSPMISPKKTKFNELNKNLPSKENKKDFHLDDYFEESCSGLSQKIQKESTNKIDLFKSKEEILQNSSRKRKNLENYSDLNVSDVALFNFTEELKEPNKKRAKINENETDKVLIAEDLWDESFFGLTQELLDGIKKKSKENVKETNNILTSKDLCDESLSSLSQKQNKECIEKTKANKKETVKILTSQDLYDESFFGLSQEQNKEYKKKSKTNEKETVKILTSQDLCDESFFGLSQKQNRECKNKSKRNEKETVKILTSQDLSDESFFGLSQEQNKGSKKKSKTNEKETVKISTSQDLCDESLFGLIPEPKDVINKKCEPMESKKSTENKDTENVSSFIQKDNKKSQYNPPDFDLNEMIDTSFFGLTQELLEQSKLNSKNKLKDNEDTLKNKNKTKEVKKVPQCSSVDLNVGSIYDESFTGFTQNLKKTTKNSGKNETLNKETLKMKYVTEKSTISKKNKSIEKLPVTHHVDLDISSICDISIFGLSKNPEKSPPKEIDKINEIITIEDSPIKNKTIESNFSDESLSPVYDYTNNITTRSLRDKTQHQKNDEKYRDLNEERNRKKDETSSPSKLLLKDLLDPTMFDFESPSKNDNDFQEEQLSPVLTQKFKKSNFLKLKLQNSSVNNENHKDVKRKLDFSSRLPDSIEKNSDNSTSFTVTQIIDIVNQPNATQSTSTENQKTKIGLSNLLDDDDDVFENISYKTPTKSMSTRKLALLKTPKSTKKLTETTFSAVKNVNIQKTPQSAKKIIEKTISFPNSDDEFQIPTGWYQKQLPLSTRKNETKSNNATPRSNRKKLKKQLKNPFIDDEAQVSFSENESDDSDSANTQNSYDASFVTQTDVLNTTAMHINYLKSVKSPLQLNRGFKIPDRLNNEDVNVFSQKENIQDNSYLEDSFCIDIPESQVPIENDLSELEIAEKLLMEEKKRKKQKHKFKQKDEVVNVKKKRRVIVLSDSE